MRRLFLNSALAVSGAILAIPAQADVANGSFETGDFTGWTQSGNTGFSGVECPGSAFVAVGNCDAFFGPSGSTGTISQTLSTVAGQSYDISFWLKTDGGTPSSFSASFDGAVLTTLTNPSASPYTLYTYLAVATTNSTLLSFTFRDDPGFTSIDGVSVQPASGVPEPATWMMMLLGFGGMGMAVRRRRQSTMAPIA